MCGGKGCTSCNQSGNTTYTSCVRKQITPDVWEMIFAVLDAGDGGYLPSQLNDQTNNFVECYRFIKTEIAEYEAEITSKYGI